MRVLQVITTLRAESGGPVQGLIQQARGLVAKGHTVHSLTLDPPGTKIADGLASNAVIFLGPSYLKYGFNLRLLPWLETHGNKYDVVVIHGIWTYHSFTVWRASRTAGFHYVLFLHGMLDPYFRRAFPLKHLKKLLYWPWAEYRAIRDATFVLFTSSEEMRLAPQSFSLYKANARLIGYGVDLPPIDREKAKNAFRQAFPQIRAERFLLFLSRIHPKKGCDLLIEAFAATLQQSNGADLVIAGPNDNPTAQALQARATELGIGDRVHFTGMLSGDLKWGAYLAADVFVLPSHQENFGIVVAEALALNLPVLTTNKVNIWREIEDAHAGFISDDTQEAINQQLVKWFSTSEATREAMRQAARVCYESQFSYAQVGGRFEAALLDAAKH